MYFRVYRTNLAQETIHKSWAHAHMATPISSPYASGWIFLFRPRKVVETFRIHQNVCNGHVYKQLMKQHILQNAFFLRYSRKTDFLMLGQHEISYFDARITVKLLVRPLGKFVPKYLWAYLANLAQETMKQSLESRPNNQVPFLGICLSCTFCILA